MTYIAGATPPNTTTTDGTATGGYVTQNADGTTADANMTYTTPTDGSTYTGNYTVTSYDSNGVQIAQASSGVTDYGTGSQMVVGYGAITLPAGGMILIRLTESNGSGKSFTAAAQTPHGAHARKSRREVGTWTPRGNPRWRTSR